MEKDELIPDSTTKLDWLLSGIFGIFAAVVYLCTVSTSVFPGESAWLVATYSGLTPETLPMRPMFGAIVAFLARLNFLTMPLRLNLFSVFCTVASTIMVYRIAAFFVRDTIREEHAVQRSGRASAWAGSVAAICYAFSAPVWQAATRLQHQSFYMFLALATASAIVAFMKTKQRWILAVFAVLWGIGAAEAPSFLPLSLVFLPLLVYATSRREKVSLANVSWVLALAAAVLLVSHILPAQTFYNAHKDALPNLHSASDVMFAVIKNQLKTLAGGMPQYKWAVLLIFGIVPWVSCVVSARRSLNNERSWSIYIFHVTMLIMEIMVLANASFSPWGIFKETAQLPLATSILTAFTSGYLMAFFYLLYKNQRMRHGQAVSHMVRVTGDWLGLVVTYLFLGITVLAAIANSFGSSGRRGAFADICANEILDRMNGRTWFITDGTLDPHLMVMAKERGQELNLICLQNDDNTEYRRQLSKTLVEKKAIPNASEQRLQHTLELGVLPLVQDWLAVDPDIAKKLAVFGIPDFWYSANLNPMPELFFFGGAKDAAKFYEGKDILGESMQFWQRMEKILAPLEGSDLTPLDFVRANLRRHLGFVANNIGVVLEDLNRPDDAFKAYTFVHDHIDPQNVSALFNRFEMARKGIGGASKYKDKIEKELKDFVSNIKQAYPLWSISRFFGYIREPQIFAKLGMSWALSGQTGAALQGVERAANLVQDEDRVNLLQTVATIYNMSGDENKTKESLEKILNEDRKNREAMLGLARIAIQNNKLKEAEEWLRKAEAAAPQNAREALGAAEWAVINLIRGDVDKARLLLQKTTDLQPNNLQAWTMLAVIQMQQGELDEVEKVTIPKITTIADTPSNYFVQTVKAHYANLQAEKLLATVKDSFNESSPVGKKIRSYQSQAREAFITAAKLRPDLPDIKNRILQLDVVMNDRESAELHARQALRQNRKHPLANYIMGSCRLQEGEYDSAESFLRDSISEQPTPAALNDLAEVLRRQKKYEEAMHFAREALKLNDKLYATWETLGSIICEMDGDLNQAEEYVRKSIDLFDGDLRVKISLAKILIKKGELERARILIGQIKNRINELPPYDVEVLKILEQATAKGK
ncbi:MAG: tetratricopeptide repeat protein [Kiritimatiellae bacterium]|nr:tetratricopeptide repeat protein [Kiritimatiellia bacterium]